MRFEFRVATRYLWSARKQLHTAFLSLISTLGLAVGVATLIVSLALLSGLQDRIKSRLLASSPHLLIESASGHAIENSELALEKASTVGNRVEPYISGMVWVSNRTREIGRPAKLRTMPLERDIDAEPFSPPGFISKAKRHVWLSRSLASALRAEPADEIVVVGPRTRLTPFGPSPVWHAYQSVLLTSRLDEDSEAEVILELDDATTLFLTNGEPTSIEVWIDDVTRVDSVRDALLSSIPDVEVKTWREINRPLFLALRLEKIVMFATISLIVLVAALNLICSLAMLVVEKRSRIGILRTIGATGGSVRLIFLSVGILIGLTGTILGNILGIGAALIADRFGLVPLPGDAMFVSHVPFQINISEVLAVNAIAMILTAIATWYPAHIASKLDPITAIREE